MNLGRTPRLPHQSSPPPSHQPNDISPHSPVKILDKPNDRPDDKRPATLAAPAKLPPGYYSCFPIPHPHLATVAVIPQQNTQWPLLQLPRVSQSPLPSCLPPAAAADPAPLLRLVSRQPSRVAQQPASPRALLLDPAGSWLADARTRPSSQFSGRNALPAPMPRRTSST